MKSLLVEFDEKTVADLERVAPARRRLRSRFIRRAVRTALDELLERQMADAYRTSPDSQEGVYFDAEAWEPRRLDRRRRR